MESTVKLQLPYIMPSQAQKHVTHNEALAILDAVVQLCVLDRDLTAPPGGESDGDCYIVAQPGTGQWEGWDDAVAVRADGAWRRIDPGIGWLAWVDDEETPVRWTGAAWSDLGDAIPVLRNLERLGIGTTADAANPFAAKINNALWTARYGSEGGDGDLRYTMNKEAPAGVLSLLMQSDWSGRAEIGLIGDDDLSLKVSADGADWKEAIRIDRASGGASFPHTPALNAFTGLTGSADRIPYYTAPDALDVAPLSPFSRARLAGTDGGSWLAGLGVRYDLGNIADDAAATIDLPSYGGNNRILIFVVGNQPVAGVGQVWANAGGAPNLGVMTQIGTTLNTVSGGGSLTGTSGPDGFCNIRTNGSNQFFLENRTGAGRAYTVFVMK